MHESITTSSSYKTEMLTVVAVFSGILLVAIDQTIVVTALPSILAEINGVTFFPWIFSSYMIAELAAMPIFGKLSDRYGRKRFFLLGIVIFLVGSLLCALANSMPTLIIARFIQGMGGGSVIPIAFTLLFNLFPPQKRYLMQGLLAAVFGLASISGPGIGAILCDYLDWRWVFLVNLPLGIVVCAFLMIKIRTDSKQPKTLPIDYKGMGLFLIAILCFLFGVELVSKTNFHPLWTTALFSIFIASSIGFIHIERRADDPVVPLYLFNKPLFAYSQLAAFIFGAIMMTVIAFMPLYIQGVSGAPAIEAGKVITPMMLGVVIGSILGGRLADKICFRNATLLAAFLALISLTLMSSINTQTHKMVIAIYMMTLGLGIGISFPVLITASLNGVEPGMLGSVNAFSMFCRNLGSAIGVLVFGAIQLAHLKQGIDLQSASDGLLSATDDYRRFFQLETRALIAQDQLDNFVSALSNSVIQVFQYVAALSIVAIGSAMAMGREKLLLPESAEYTIPDPNIE